MIVKRYSIELGSELILTDPMYEIGVEHQVIIKNVKPGKYKVEYVYLSEDEDDDGIEQVAIFLRHEDTKDIFDNYDKMVESTPIGVDSGAIGAFDCDYYKNDFEVELFMLLSEERKLYEIDGKGVLGKTALGDGSYTADIFSRDDKISGVIIYT